MQLYNYWMMCVVINQRLFTTIPVPMLHTNLKLMIILITGCSPTVGRDHCPPLVLYHHFGRGYNGDHRLTKPNNTTHIRIV